MAEDTIKFFEKIWGDTKGFVYLPNRSNMDPASWKKVIFEWPAKKDTIARYVEWAAAEKREVFYAPAIFKDDSGNVSNNNILGSHVLWTDFDGDGGTPAPTEWAGLSGTVSEPSLRVQTSRVGNEHVFWIVPFTTDIDWIQAKNKSLAYTLDSDKACWNANRLLRPPGSINYGYAKPERKGVVYPVELIEISDRQYGEEHFAHLRSIRTLIKESFQRAKSPL